MFINPEYTYYHVLCVFCFLNPTIPVRSFTICEDFSRDVTPADGENMPYILNLFIFIYN
jgi:hypothetical protein